MRSKYRIEKRAQAIIEAKDLICDLHPGGCEHHSPREICSVGRAYDAAYEQAESEWIDYCEMQADERADR